MRKKTTIRPKQWCDKISQSLLGKKLSLEHRKKLSIAKKGKPSNRKGVLLNEKQRLRLKKVSFQKGNIPWNKGIPFYAIRGENNCNWKGGISKENNRNRMIIEYKLWRLGVLKRDFFTCRCCGARGGKLQAHHIKSFSRYKDLRYDINNGLTLCKKCHEKTDNYGYKSLIEDKNSTSILNRYEFMKGF